MKSVGKLKPKKNRDKSSLSFTEEERKLFSLLKEQRSLPNFNPVAHRRYVEHLMSIFRPGLHKQVLEMRAGKSPAQIAKDSKTNPKNSKGKSQRALKWLKAALIDPTFDEKMDT